MAKARDWSRTELRIRDALKVNGGGPGQETLRSRNYPATPKQLKYIADLAKKAEVDAPPAGTRQQAAEEIRRLRALT